MTVNPRDSPTGGALWGAVWAVIPEKVARQLDDAGAVLEIGCGRGLACVALAQAFPTARIRGHDPDPTAVAQAAALAAEVGLGERLRFAKDDSMRLPRATFALVVVSGILARPDPRALLNTIRNALVPDGACLALESTGLGAVARTAGFSRAAPPPLARPAPALGARPLTSAGGARRAGCARCAGSSPQAAGCRPRRNRRRT